MEKTLQEEVAEEIIIELKKDPSVIGIEIAGSLARGEIRSDSDVDFGVTSTTAEKDKLVSKTLKGIKVDIWINPVSVLKKVIEEYPYLFGLPSMYIIVYDPKNILSEAYEIMQDYYQNHPEVAQFWEKELDLHRLRRQAGIKSKNFYRVLDEAEIRFSNKKKVTRDFYIDD